MAQQLHSYHVTHKIGDDSMKNQQTGPIIIAVGMGALLLILGTVAPRYAQQGQQQGNDQHKQDQEQAKDQPQRQEQAKDQPQRQEQAKVQPQRQEQAKVQVQRQEQAKVQVQRQEQAKVQVQRQEQAKRQQAQQPSQPVQRVEQSEQHGVWAQHRAHSWQTEHRTWQQRGGYDGFHIPDYHFRGYFGPRHTFRINSLSLEIFGGYPRFQYNDYWFSILDPWPEYWPDDWYENDDVYVNYTEDGYYLYNRRYPGDRIAITVYVH